MLLPAISWVAAVLAATNPALTLAGPVNATPIPPTPVPPAITADTVNPLVVGVGVFVLLLLFAASFYFVVVWPKRSLRAYRAKFEELVNRDRLRGDNLDLGPGEANPLYSGAKVAREGATARIPTMNRIQEMRREREKAMEGGLASAILVDPDV